MSEKDLSKQIGHDLVVSTIKPHRAGSSWLIGSVAGYRFTALIFPKHARDRTWEIGDSQICKLWLHRLKDRQVVFAWERGPYRRAEDQKTQAVVDFLTSGSLREVAFPELKSARQSKRGQDLRVLEGRQVEFLGDPRRAGIRITASVDGHWISADIFPNHPAISGWDLGESRISRLLVHNARTCVFNWNRGKHQSAYMEEGKQVTMKRLSRAEKLQSKAIVEFLTSGPLTDAAAQYQGNVVQTKSAAELKGEADAIKRQLRKSLSRSERRQGPAIERERG